MVNQRDFNVLCKRNHYSVKNMLDCILCFHSTTNGVEPSIFVIWFAYFVFNDSPFKVKVFKVAA